MNKMVIVCGLIGIALNLLALFCGLPIVVILWINLCYGSLMRLGYLADGNWRAVFRHILPPGIRRSDHPVRHALYGPAFPPFDSYPHVEHGLPFLWIAGKAAGSSHS